MASSLQLLIEKELGYTFREFYETAQAEKMSYRQMVEVIDEETGRRVSKSSVHLWAQKEREING